LTGHLCIMNIKWSCGRSMKRSGKVSKMLR
jgi:hypothetical protein